MLTATSPAKIADDAVTADKLADTAVTAGSYTFANITVDAQGRLTAASSGTISSDAITEGDTSVEVTDTGSNGTITFTTDGSPRATIDSSGRLLVGTATALSGPKSQFAKAIIANYNGGSGTTYLGLSNDKVLTSTVNNEELGVVTFSARDADFATITGVADGTPASGDTPGRLVFATTADGASSPTEQLRITSDRFVRLASGTGGIQFNGDTAAANALDDYEEGTWTVNVYDAASGGNVSATTTTGHYTKIGRCVSCLFASILNINTTGMTAGNLVYVSLPFVASLATTALPGGTLFLEGITLPASNTYVTPVLSHSHGRFLIYTGGASGGPRTALTVGNLTSGTTDFRYFQMTYFI